MDKARNLTEVAYNLNTSHVKVHRLAITTLFSGTTNLNTSHVKVHQKWQEECVWQVKSAEASCLILYKVLATFLLFFCRFTCSETCASKGYDVCMMN